MQKKLRVVTSFSFSKYASKEDKIKVFKTIFNTTNSKKKIPQKKIEPIMGCKTKQILNPINDRPRL